MPDLYAGVLIGFICGIAAALGWSRWTIEQSKAIRRRHLPDLTRIYDENQGY